MDAVMEIVGSKYGASVVDLDLHSFLKGKQSNMRTIAHSLLLNE